MQKIAFVPLAWVLAASLSACSVVDEGLETRQPERRQRVDGAAKTGAPRWDRTVPAPWSSIPFYSPLPESDGLSRRLAEKRLSHVVEIVGRPVIRGSLAREVINRYIENHRRQLRSCHQHAMRQGRRLDGRMSIRFIIGPVGRVSTISIRTSTVNHPEVEQCIIDVLRTIEYPSAGMGIVIAEYELLVRS